MPGPAGRRHGRARSCAAPMHMPIEAISSSPWIADAADLGQLAHHRHQNRRGRRDRIAGEEVAAGVPGRRARSPWHRRVLTHSATFSAPSSRARIGHIGTGCGVRLLMVPPTGRPRRAALDASDPTTQLHRRATREGALRGRPNSANRPLPTGWLWSSAQQCANALHDPPRPTFVPVDRNPSYVALQASPLGRLTEALFDPFIGRWMPAKVADAIVPGVMLNPTRKQADTVLRQAVREAASARATLLFYFVGHSAEVPTPDRYPPLRTPGLGHEGAAQVGLLAIALSTPTKRSQMSLVRLRGIAAGVIVMVDTPYGSKVFTAVDRARDVTPRTHAIRLAGLQPDTGRCLRRVYDPPPCRSAAARVDP